MREANDKTSDHKVCVLGLWAAQEAEGRRLVELANALESGRLVRRLALYVFSCFVTQTTLSFRPDRVAYRDIGGSDPERMAAPRVAEYVQEMFKNSPVQVRRNPAC